MTNNLKRQVEVQGTKKLDSVKGVQTLSLSEMRNTEGGRRLPSGKQLKEFAKKIYDWFDFADTIDEFIEGWNSCKC